MEIRIHALKNLNAKQQTKIRLALKDGESVLDSEIWADKIRSARYTEARGFTGQQLVDMIRSGSHDGGPADYAIDVSFDSFYKYNNVVGHTFLGSAWQWINRRFLDRYSPADIFAHLIHELMHRSFRFVHKGKFASSVPYQCGRLSKEAFKEYYSKPREAPFVGSTVKITFVN